MPSGGVVYTVPAGTALIAKSFIFQEHAGTSAHFQLVLVAQSGTPTVVMFDSSLAAFAFVRLSEWLCLNPGDQLYISAISGQVRYWLSGALLPEGTVSSP